MRSKASGVLLGGDEEGEDEDTGDGCPGDDGPKPWEVKGDVQRFVEPVAPAGGPPRREAESGKVTVLKRGQSGCEGVDGGRVRKD